MLMAVESTGAAAMVRTQSGERLRIGRALDQGATGIMIPRMQSAAEVAEAVTFLRYPPTGVRGVALRTRGAGLGTVAHADVGQINDRIVGIVQIESVGALDEADAIAATDGVDVLFVGPADLSHSLGVPGQFGHKTYLAALDTVVAACRAHGKSPASWSTTPRSWRADSWSWASDLSASAPTAPWSQPAPTPPWPPSAPLTPARPLHPPRPDAVGTPSVQAGGRALPASHRTLDANSGHQLRGGCSPASRRGAGVHASVGQNRDRLDLDEERSGQLDPD